MKAIKYLFITILSLFFYFVPSITVKASLIPSSQLPSVIPSAQQTQVMDFTTSLPTAYYNSTGVSLFGSSTFSDAITAYNSESYLPSAYNWTSKPLNTMAWRPEANLYDKQGNLVDPEQVVLCMGDNDYGNTYFLYDSVSGDILNIGTSYESSISSVNGFVNNKFWNFVQDVAETFGFGSQAEVVAPCAIYDDSLKTSQQIETMLQLPNSFVVYCTTQYSPWYIMCPDVTNEHVYSDGNGHLYCDAIGRDMVVYGNTSAWDGNPYWSLPISYDNYNFNGHVYTMCIPSLYRGFNTDGVFSIKQMPKSPTVRNDNTSDVVWVTPTESYSLPDTLNMDSLNNNPINYNRAFNPNYVTNEYVTYNNYPIQTIPQTIPNYSPIYNYYNDYIEYINTPQIGETIGSSQTQVPTDIPILSNLEKRFPFSIPWDIYNLFQGLKVTPEAPNFSYELQVPILDFTYTFEVDLQSLDNLAALFRNLILILFIIGLAVFSYNHFFGS